MKTLRKDKRKWQTLFLFGALLGTFASGLSAQEFDDVDDVLNSAQIDVDGNFQQKPKETAADRMAKFRKNMEHKHEQMVRKKIEDIRLREERKLAKKLRKTFNNGMLDDSVSTNSAAVSKVKVPAVVVVNEVENRNKIVPTVGVANLSSDIIDFESSANVGLKFDFQVQPRYSFGFGVSYSKFDILDVSNQLVYGGGYGGASNNGFYDNGYYGVYGQGREMTYKRTSIDVNGKFFVIPDGMVRPYVGAGLGYNRTSLKYEDNIGSFQYQGVQLGEEGYSGSFMSGSVSGGMEFYFSNKFGLNIDFTYTKGLGTGSDSKQTQLVQNPDQLRLENLAKEIEDASMGTINLGMVIRF